MAFSHDNNWQAVHFVLFCESTNKHRVQAIENDKIQILWKNMEFTSLLIKIVPKYVVIICSSNQSSISKHMIKILCGGSSIFSSPCVELDWFSWFKLNKKE